MNNVEKKPSKKTPDYMRVSFKGKTSNELGALREEVGVSAPTNTNTELAQLSEMLDSKKATKIFEKHLSPLTRNPKFTTFFSSSNHLEELQALIKNPKTEKEANEILGILLDKISVDPEMEQLMKDSLTPSLLDEVGNGIASMWDGFSDKTGKWVEHKKDQWWGDLIIGASAGLIAYVAGGNDSSGGILQRLFNKDRAKVAGKYFLWTTLLVALKDKEVMSGSLYWKGSIWAGHKLAQGVDNLHKFPQMFVDGGRRGFDGVKSGYNVVSDYSSGNDAPPQEDQNILQKESLAAIKSQLDHFPPEIQKIYKRIARLERLAVKDTKGDFGTGEIFISGSPQEGSDELANIGQEQQEVVNEADAKIAADYIFQSLKESMPPGELFSFMMTPQGKQGEAWRKFYLTISSNSLYMFFSDHLPEGSAVSKVFKDRIKELVDQQKNNPEKALDFFTPADL